MGNRFDLLFMASLYAHAQDLEGDVTKAVEGLFKVLDNKVRYQEYNKVLKKLSKSLGVDLGFYDNEQYKFENEEKLKQTLIKYVENSEKTIWR